MVTATVVGNVWATRRLAEIPKGAFLEVEAEGTGQRFVAFFVMDEVQDANREGGNKTDARPNTPQKADGLSKVREYLCILTEPRDGLPYDYDQVRVFTWNIKRHRYETAYREHGVDGVLPVTVAKEDFDKEGTLPVFILRVKDDTGKVSERKYKLNTPIVRRVLAPGEQPAKVAKRRTR